MDIKEFLVLILAFLNLWAASRNVGTQFSSDTAEAVKTSAAVTSVFGNEKALDDSPCHCQTIPSWNDTPFGRDVDTNISLSEKNKLDLIIQKYVFLMPITKVSALTVGVQYPFSIEIQNHTCGDTFYSQLQGPTLEEIRFELVQDDGFACIYGALFRPVISGSYRLRVWLTHRDYAGFTEPSSHGRYISRRNRQRLRRKNGRLGNIGISLQDLSKDHSFLLGMPLKELHLSPFEFRVNERAQEIKKEPLCLETDIPGFFVRKIVCESDQNCKAGITVSLLQPSNLQYIWKPRGCRLPSYGSRDEFESKLYEISGVKERSILIVGDSLQAEEFCYFNQFLASRSFDDIDCSKSQRKQQLERPNNTRSDYLQVWGMYDSFYGFRDLPLRTDQILLDILSRANGSDMVIWNDAAHSLVKTDTNDIIRILRKCSIYFTKFRSRDILRNVVYRMPNYVHSIRSLSARKSADGYYYSDSARFQQPHRISIVKQAAKNMLDLYDISAYDSSLVHAARPEASRDGLHWGQTACLNDTCNRHCSEYCSGKWIFPSHRGRIRLERHRTVLSWASLQLFLSMIVLETQKMQNVTEVITFELPEELTFDQIALEEYRTLLLTPSVFEQKYDSKQLSEADLKTEASMLIALIEQRTDKKAERTLLAVPLSETCALTDPHYQWRSESPLARFLQRTNTSVYSYLKKIEEVLESEAISNLVVISSSKLCPNLPVHQLLIKHEKKAMQVITTAAWDEHTESYLGNGVHISAVVPHFSPASCRTSVHVVWNMGKARPNSIFPHKEASGNTAEMENKTSRFYESYNFCVLPTDAKLFSSKLIDAIAALCIPIITKGSLMLPFAEAIPWSKMAFFFDDPFLHNRRELFLKIQLISHREIKKMRYVISQNMNKLLWNWHHHSHGSCPQWMWSSTRDSPASLLRKRYAGGFQTETHVVANLNMSLR